MWTSDSQNWASCSSYRFSHGRGYFWIILFIYKEEELKNKEELKSFLMKVKEESKKAGLKLNIQKTKIMASGPITSGQIEKKWKQWQILFSWAPKSVNGDCRQKIKWCLLFGRKALTNRQHIKKQSHHFANKGPLVKTMVFPVVMYGCESWTVKKAEHWRTGGF